MTGLRQRSPEIVAHGRFNAIPAMEPDIDERYEDNRAWVPEPSLSIRFCGQHGCVNPRMGIQLRDRD